MCDFVCNPISICAENWSGLSRFIDIVATEKREYDSQKEGVAEIMQFEMDDIIDTSVALVSLALIIRINRIPKINSEDEIYMRTFVEALRTVSSLNSVTVAIYFDSHWRVINAILTLMAAIYGSWDCTRINIAIKQHMVDGADKTCEVVRGLAQNMKIVRTGLLPCITLERMLLGGTKTKILHNSGRLTMPVKVNTLEVLASYAHDIHDRIPKRLTEKVIIILDIAEAQKKLGDLLRQTSPTKCVIKVMVPDCNVSWIMGYIPESVVSLKLAGNGLHMLLPHIPDAIAELYVVVPARAIRSRTLEKFYDGFAAAMKRSENIATIRALFTAPVQVPDDKKNTLQDVFMDRENLKYFEIKSATSLSTIVRKDPDL